MSENRNCPTGMFQNLHAYFKSTRNDVNADARSKIFTQMKT